ncbi:MAG TPA: amino acid dehydrogenase, partial [Bacillus bacterium]|nr:amino acid dehydrogenase [Bacillus sp. (in: firmicutes)]
MGRGLFTLLFLFLILITMPACNTVDNTENLEEKQQVIERVKEKKQENKQKDKAKESSIEIDPLPSTYEELSKLPVGELADFRPDTSEPEKTLEAFKDLPDISS